MFITKLNQSKFEAPLIFTFFIFSLIFSIATYPIYLWYSFLIFPVMALVYLFLKINKIGLFKRFGFLKIDEEGISYLVNVFQSPIIIKWDLIEKIDFLMYEINITLKKNAQIVCLNKNNFKNKETEKEFVDFLKQMINSKLIKN